jgi:hypothetical protein
MENKSRITSTLIREIKKKTHSYIIEKPSPVATDDVMNE